MYHVTTVERDDDGNLYCFHNIRCSELSEAAGYVDYNQQHHPKRHFGMTIIRTVIESEREGGPRPIGEVVQPIVKRVTR